MPKSGLTYGVDITSRTQLIDGLDSQRVFFDDEAKLHELEPSANPFLTVLLGMKTAKKKASGDLESYVEHRGSYINDPLYFVKASDTPLSPHLMQMRQNTVGCQYRGLPLAMRLALTRSKRAT